MYLLIWSFRKRVCRRSERGSRNAAPTAEPPPRRCGGAALQSLCNACGIRHRKKRAVAKNDVKKGKIGKTRNLIPLGKEVEVAVGRRSAPKRLRRPKEWGEVERAALLLMALSFGAVFA
ncbi:GATA transcription factor 16-like isoform X3 [Salvia splendens]|uniref:GATA transcription factor 16-like isoform X3 n=1 Tax=Salvia splendens TaxID=180675 RepID=UPI001C279DCB|nr:GATA transcription factor 16-like isoform X3 [Salvia splendens]